MELFDYGKQEGYRDGARLLDQLTNKALPIAQFLYPAYDLIFLFDNARSHAIWEKEKGINKVFSDLVGIRIKNQEKLICSQCGHG